MRFLNIAKAGCANVVRSVADHFADIGKMIPLSKVEQNEMADLAITKYGCKMVTQNHDSSKIEIAFAQTFFPVEVIT